MSDEIPANRYRLEGKIADGTTCEVWRARWVDLDSDVVLKLLRVRSPDAEELFVREAQITAQLTHPGVPPLSDLDILPDGRPYIAMKLIKGQTLAELLGDHVPSTSQWLGVFEVVCQTVGYAHARGVVHCGLEPAHVMIGAFGEVIVLDWGLAKLLPDGSIRHACADAGGATTRDANPAYMSPEQAAGDVDAIDPRSDVFSLGAMLCELLTGLPPYDEIDQLELRRLAVYAELTNAFHRLDRCGAGRPLVELCKWCLSADPNARPPDAMAVSREITQLRSHR